MFENSILLNFFENLSKKEKEISIKDSLISNVASLLGSFDTLLFLLESQKDDAFHFCQHQLEHSLRYICVKETPRQLIWPHIGRFRAL
jgi:hypothetical protein